ncbi:MAG: hypothetical protein J6Y03_01470 [Alphaproteobacteria bacterium]|nr:hypothetical protein [Alphaproteobacteria bacterium]
MKEIDINTWYRKDYFLYYKSFFSSLFSVSLEVEAKKAYHFCKENHFSFFIFCLYAFLKASNETEQFRHRLIDERVYDMEELSAITPVMIPNDPNHQFTMVECPYLPTFDEFNKETKKRIENAKSNIIPDDNDDKTKGLVCLNCVPWFSFTACDNALCEPHQSMPLMTWGKLKGENMILPYSMLLTHMFIDGYHVWQFVDHLERFFANPEKI